MDAYTAEAIGTTVTAAMLIGFGDIARRYFIRQKELKLEKIDKFKELLGDPKFHQYLDKRGEISKELIEKHPEYLTGPAINLEEAIDAIAGKPPFSRWDGD